MHISIPIDGKMEIINATKISPLISHCKVKVCYVGQEPNRNGTVITKEVATEMGRNLPGSPIVGRFNEETGDFGGHDREIILNGNEFKIVETTKPYGFVPTDATVWFEKFNDDGVVHEYLVTECYIWTSAYPESKVILEHGNNHSMELDSEKSTGNWANDLNSGYSFFIYNEALIEKLCILGQDVEPCFEGSQITAFSLNTENLRKEMYSMMNQLQEILNKGGSQPMENENNATQTQFEQKEKEKEKEVNQPQDEKEDEKNKKPNDDNACGNKKKYNLDEIPEYQTLLGQYQELKNQFSALQETKTALDIENAQLKEFRLSTERQNKQSMIDSFYMLSDEDKKDVVEHIDTYSLDEIEAKLSVICVRNKVDFSAPESDTQQKGDNQQTPEGLFSLNNLENDNVPAWIAAVRNTAKNQ